MVYPVTNTGAPATIAVVEKWILHFGIPQSIIHERGINFLDTDFVNWTKELGVTLRPRTAHSLWTNEKVETQNQRIARYWRSFSNDAGTNWALLTPKFAFAHNTSVNYTTGKTPSENHRFLCLSNWDFIVTNINNVAQNSVPTCFLIPTTRTLRRMSSFRKYFAHNYLRLC